MVENERTIYVTYKGQRKTLGEWARDMDVSWNALYMRIVRRGWSVTRAMETPFQRSTKPARRQLTLEFFDENDEV